MEEETRLLEDLQSSQENNNERKESGESSEESDSCLICFHAFEKDSVYAIINSKNEKFKKYHPECLDKWFQIKPKGLFTNENVKTYTIYQNDTKIEEVVIPHNLIINNNENYIYEQTDVESQNQINVNITSNKCSSDSKYVLMVFSLVLLIFAILLLFLFL